MNIFLIKCFRYYLLWYFAIAVNTIVLFYFFLLPRASFLLKNPGYSHKDVRMSTGTSDNKNVNAIAFKLAYEIKDLTPENSAITFSNKEINLTSKAAMIQILFPRGVYFKEKFQFISRAQFSNEIFYLFKKESNKYCNANNSKNIKILNDVWYLCRNKNYGLKP